MLPASTTQLKPLSQISIVWRHQETDQEERRLLEQTGGLELVQECAKMSWWPLAITLRHPRPAVPHTRLVAAPPYLSVCPMTVAVRP